MTEPKLTPIGEIFTRTRCGDCFKQACTGMCPYDDGSEPNCLVAANRASAARVLPNSSLDIPMPPVEPTRGLRPDFIAPDMRSSFVVAPPAIVDYTNHRGERRIRTIEPRGIFWGSTPHHPEDQWLLEVYDFDKKTERTYALKDIHSWAPADSASGRSMASFAKQLQLSIERNARMVTRLKALQDRLDGRVSDGAAYDASPMVHRTIQAILNDQDPT